MFRTTLMCILAGVWCVAAGNRVLGQAETAPPPVLPGRPGPVTAPATGPSVLKLGDTLTFARLGVSLRQPEGMTASRFARPDEIVGFRDAGRDWSINLKRYILPEPYPLNSVVAIRGSNRVGMVEVTLKRIKDAAPDAEALRNDSIYVGDAETGMLALRYSFGSQRKLMQRALIQANEQMYYDLTMISPGATRADVEDPVEREAVEAFRAVLDSIKLLDLLETKRDQEERLFNSRAFFTDVKTRLQKVLIPEQVYRILRDGKDIGYSYSSEHIDKLAGGEGIELGTMTRLLRGDEQDDINLICGITGDLRHEQFSQILVTGKTSQNFEDRNWVMGFGTSDRNTRIRYDRELDEKTVDADIDPRTGRPRKQPAVREREVCELNVTFYGRHSNPDPFTQPVPPWYLPQAVGRLLPRLLPLSEKKYLFASYQSDENYPVVRSRYVDVLLDEDVNIGGQKVRAVPIRDWMDEATVTTHYIALDGKYLGSETRIDHWDAPASTVTVIPSDAAAITKLWPQAKLEAPKKLERPATRPANAKPGTPRSLGR